MAGKEEGREEEKKKFSIWDLPDVPMGQLPPHLELQRSRVLCNKDAPIHVFLSYPFLFINHPLFFFYQVYVFSWEVFTNNLYLYLEVKENWFLGVVLISDKKESSFFPVWDAWRQDPLHWACYLCCSFLRFWNLWVSLCVKTKSLMFWDSWCL